MVKTLGKHEKGTSMEKFNGAPLGLINDFEDRIM